MALDGPYTLDDLMAMTGQKKSRKSRQIQQLDALKFPASMGPLRLLGIDPGTRFVGWGVIERTSARSFKLIDCGCIAPGEKRELPDRLTVIFEELEEAIKRTRPHAAALEETFAGVNMQSAIAMGEGRGVALLALARARLPILELSPRTIKFALTGNGASGKAGVAAMVQAQLRLKEAPKPADITDALAAAITLAQRVDIR